MFIGAVYALEKRGFIIEKAGGTSIGSIIASLLMVGYKPKELISILLNINLLDFKNTYSISNVKKFGLTEISKIKNFLEKLYKTKKIEYFYQLKKDNDYLLKTTTTNFKYKNQIIIPNDLYLFNINPDTFKIIDSVIMSSSFPLIYTPFKLNNEYFLDGGIKENFNINLFNEYKGLKIGFNIVKKLKQQFEYINNVHVINIPIKIKTFNFSLTKEEIIELLKTGYDVTNKWIEMYFLGNNIVKKQRVFNE